MAKINDENLLISIIIPVYNAEKYIEQCLNSIKNQTYNYFEVILVNDGSKDNSENICKKFSNSDARFRYFVKEHGGVSSARNLGLDNAQGYYITFIDSDDWVDENHLELLVNNIKENNSDMAVSSIKNFNNIDTFYFRANTNQEKYLLNFNKMRKEEFLVNLPKLILAQNSYKIVVSKLFKKDFIHDIRFEETIIYVNDTQFLFDLYLKMNSISYINEATYIYRLHDESPSSNFNQQYTEQELLIYKKMYEKIAELNLPTIHYVNTIRKFLDLQKDFLENSILFNEYLDFLENIEKTVTYPNALISIIVPIYNVYPYLQFCLESIANQTYLNFEVLLINDGSRDNSKDICLEFVKKDTRFKYIEQKNAGLSASRNTGIINSKGEFITFIDGDDFIDPNYLEELYYATLKTDSEIVIGNYKEFNEEDNNYYIHVFDYREEYYNQKELLKKRGVEFETSWGILFHKRLFENILFPVDKCIGDSFTNYKLFMESCKTSYIHKDSYVHRIRKGSLTKPITEQLLSDTLEILLERIAILSLSGIDVTDENEILRNQLTFRLQQATEAGLESTDIYRRYREVLYLLE
ncbi:glycosyltransferase family 2 protein [Streptococcus mitis]|jgi:glycosyl transferase, family 2/glycosyl transferase family 8|uniref:glycosyltransferase family 2 protein n=1 Tax=Streptococcus mitis TaxID=28037 RepID=UPI0021B848F2|nr:glycosyltransferase family 2 protein [Streptococcus mitis]